MLFLEGVAVVVSGVIVFCGSVFFLLAIVMGARLAYFISASIVLAFVSIMGAVWAVNPTGNASFGTSIGLLIGGLLLMAVHLVGLSRLEKRGRDAAERARR